MFAIVSLTLEHIYTDYYLWRVISEFVSLSDLQHESNLFQLLTSVLFIYLSFVMVGFQFLLAILTCIICSGEAIDGFERVGDGNDSEAYRNHAQYSSLDSMSIPRRRY